jgi:hypothetical protein
MGLFKRNITKEIFNAGKDVFEECVVKPKATLTILKPANGVGVAIECQSTRPAVDFMLLHLFVGLMAKEGYTKKEFMQLLNMADKNKNTLQFQEVKETKPTKKTKKKNESK